MSKEIGELLENPHEFKEELNFLLMISKIELSVLLYNLADRDKNLEILIFKSLTQFCNCMHEIHLFLENYYKGEYKSIIPINNNDLLEWNSMREDFIFYKQILNNPRNLDSHYNSHNLIKFIEKAKEKIKEENININLAKEQSRILFYIFFGVDIIGEKDKIKFFLQTMFKSFNFYIKYIEEFVKTQGRKNKVEEEKYKAGIEKLKDMLDYIYFFGENFDDVLQDILDNFDSIF